MCALVSYTASFQPPPLIEYFPVLHYVVSYNTSDNSTVIQTQLSSSISSYTVSSELGVTYYITVRAVNAVGPGDINGYSIVNGKIIEVDPPLSEPSLIRILVYQTSKFGGEYHYLVINIINVVCYLNLLHVYMLFTYLNKFSKPVATVVWI